ncbi:hypothetical protein SAMN02982929_00943 [Saccharopolyspora kobensis]|uniref:Uncharacterized protein n=1 Tax=Saccharopolyspora kobensis TaxID=146035 RepID=A0A1H5VP11_9PSEU|nr:hypothetical protein [Saccharopolyspora kobensis]SEF89039.1 hypothetical protein SAMN02982929_00943 [Saccharopolyspora kobensis]SFC58657.1 hypothetical protein SAMN05216506_1011127 [Saccharopolyspora kobensis]
MKYIDPATAGEPPAITQSVAALRMMAGAHETVNHAELTLIESVIDNGWTWERLGSVYGDRSKQAMQQHYKRRGGERNWRERPAGPDGQAAVRDAMQRVILNFRAIDEALTHTMSDAVWNERDPEQEAERRRSPIARLTDSAEELVQLVTNRVHAEVDAKTVEGKRTVIDKVIAGIEQHRDTLDETLTELQRLRAELDDPPADHR